MLYLLYHLLHLQINLKFLYEKKRINKSMNNNTFIFLLLLANYVMENLCFQSQLCVLLKTVMFKTRYRELTWPNSPNFIHEICLVHLSYIHFYISRTYHVHHGVSVYNKERHGVTLKNIFTFLHIVNNITLLNVPSGFHYLYVVC